MDNNKGHWLISLCNNNNNNNNNMPHYSYNICMPILGYYTNHNLIMVTYEVSTESGSEAKLRLWLPHQFPTQDQHFAMHARPCQILYILHLLLSGPNGQMCWV